MKLRLAIVPVVLLLAGCDAAGGERAAPPSSAAPPASARPSPTPAATPTFVDVSRGDTDSFVRLLSFTPGKGKAVVVEPVIYLENPAFCKTMRIPLDSKQCGLYAYGIEPSGAKITVPRADNATYALAGREGSRDCLDDKRAGTCEVSAAAFKEWLGQGDDVVRLITKDGVAVRLAELRPPD